MKLISTVFSALILVANSVSAQIIVTHDDFAGANDQLFYKQAVSLDIDYHTTGANQTWNFTNLTGLNNSTTSFHPISGLGMLTNITFGPLALTNYRASYRIPFDQLPIDQLSGILPIEFDDIYQYRRKIEQRMTSIGYSVKISGQEIPIKSDSIEINYVFPLEFGDTYQSTGFSKLDLSAFIDARWVQKRRRTSEVDGWGTLTTDFGTYDVIRMKHMIVEVDTVEFSGTNIGIPIPMRMEYEWIAKNEKGPVMRVTTAFVAGEEVPVIIEIKDNVAAGINEIAKSTTNLVYPNPSNNVLKFNLEMGDKLVVVTDVTGKEVVRSMVDASINEMDISHIEKGFYCIQISQNGQSHKSSFLKN